MQHYGFYVWNPEANKPRFRHDSLDSAVRESERLAKDSPGQQFIVLQIMGTSVIEPPRIFKPAQFETDLPF